MVDTKSPGDKTLSVPTKTLTLKPRVETGTVRQSFSHGRTKQVVVAKRAKPAVKVEPRKESGVVLRTLTDEERSARAFKLRELKEQEVAEEEAKRRAKIQSAEKRF